MIYISVFKAACLSKTWKDMSRGRKCFRTPYGYQEFIPRKLNRISFKEIVLFMIYRSAVDVPNFYSPSVPEEDIGISTCHFNSFEGIHGPFKLLSAILSAHLGQSANPASCHDNFLTVGSTCNCSCASSSGFGQGW